uniref:G-protein coupled receptors family 1 profile domain-containing protein n=1 Tax=Xenopus tropicalis TaxID=8364 RepID=A0A6I8SPF6_XENTR
MENQTMLLKFILAGLSDLPSLQLPLFLVFLLIYLITLTGNLLILLLIFTDSHLHTPMYFFLGTLACLDMSYSSELQLLCPILKCAQTSESTSINVTIIFLIRTYIHDLTD